MSFYEKVRRQKFLTFTLMLFTLSIGIVIGTLVQTGAKAAKEQTAAPTRRRSPFRRLYRYGKRIHAQWRRIWSPRSSIFPSTTSRRQTQN